MSHHLDSPIARQDVRLHITDLYVFRGQVGTVFVINVCHSIAKPKITGYHPEGMYEIKVDLNGDAIEEITYRFHFEERDAQGKQKYTIRRLSGKEAVDPHATGTVVAQGTTDQMVTGSSGLRAWAGHAGDPFWIEPDVLHAVGHAFEDGTIVNLAGWDPGKAHNLFAGDTVYAMVLEVPDADLLGGAGDNKRIGVWAVATLATDAGGGTVEDPRAYAEKIAHRMLPNMLPYPVGTEASLGFVEWNGRSLADHAPNVMFSTAANTPIQLGIGKESVTSKPRKTFPYVPVAV